jgi:hypothetical protein
VRIIVVALVLIFSVVALVPQLFAAAKKTPPKGHTYEECVTIANARMMGGGKDSSGRAKFIADCQKGTQQ